MMAANGKKTDFIEAILREIARRGRLLTLGTGTFVLCGFAIISVTAAALVDRWVILDSIWRVWVLRVLIVLVGLGAASTAALALRRTATLFVARRVETEYPDFKDALVTYVQMRKGHSLTEEQRQVLRVVGRRAGVMLTAIDPDRVVNARRFVVAGVALAVSICAFLVPCVASWSRFTTSVRRVLAPRGGIAPATATRFRTIRVEPSHGPPTTVLPGRCAAIALREGSCTVAAHLCGKLPASATLFFRPAAGDSPWRSQPRGQSQTEGLWTWRLETGRDALVFYIAAGDVRSDRYMIRLIEPPAVTAIRARLIYPAYTKLAATDHDGGDVVALRGTRVVLTATTNRPAAAQASHPCPALAGRRALPHKRCLKPVLHSDLRLIDLRPQACTLSASLVVHCSFSYSLHFPDHAGFWNPSPPVHTVRCVPDQAPSVAIVEPTDNRRVPIDLPVAVRVRATDDIAVADLELLCRRGEAPAHRVRLPVQRPEPQLDLSHSLDLRALDVEPGATLELRARATDGKAPGPQQRTSPPVRLTVLAPAEPHKPQPRAALPQKPQAAQVARPPQGAPQRPADSPKPEQASQPTPGQQLERLADRQQRLAERMAKPHPDPDGRELADQQDQIARRLEQLSRDIGPSAPSDGPADRQEPQGTPQAPQGTTPPAQGADITAPTKAPAQAQQPPAGDSGHQAAASPAEQQRPPAGKPSQPAQGQGTPPATGGERRQAQTSEPASAAPHGTPGDASRRHHAGQTAPRPPQQPDTGAAPAQPAQAPNGGPRSGGQSPQSPDQAQRTTAPGISQSRDGQRTPAAKGGQRTQGTPGQATRPAQSPTRQGSPTEASGSPGQCAGGQSGGAKAGQAASGPTPGSAAQQPAGATPGQTPAGQSAPAAAGTQAGEGTGTPSGQSRAAASATRGPGAQSAAGATPSPPSQSAGSGQPSAGQGQAAAGRSQATQPPAGQTAQGSKGGQATGTGQAGQGATAGSRAPASPAAGQGTTGGQAPPGQATTRGGAAGSTPGSTAGGGSGLGDELRQLAGQLRTLAQQIRHQPPGEEAARAAAQAARDLNAFGRKLRSGEFAHRRVPAERAQRPEKHSGMATPIAAGQRQAAGRQLPTDVPMPHPDEMRRLVENRAIRLSPAYRRLVERYLEAVANE